MTHPRVSPDGELITFTRYNKKGRGGLALEELGYEDTEVMLIRADGTGLETIIPPENGIVAGNSSWTPDGRGLIYVSTDNPEKKPQINHIDLDTREISRLPTPANLRTTDPHIVGDRLVFPVQDGEYPAIWTMKADGSEARQLTYPAIPEPEDKGHFRLGDYDPRLSPDGSRVAFMRYFGKANWHMIVADVETGEERDLSPPKSVDSVPNWSSDGKVLIFWHADPKDLPKTGLYTVKPDGTERKMIPLPRGFLHKSPDFFPGEGSSGQTRIIFAATKDARLK